MLQQLVSLLFCSLPSLSWLSPKTCRWSWWLGSLRGCCSPRWGVTAAGEGWGWAVSIVICCWCLWLRCFIHLWHPGWAAVGTVFDPIQKAVFWLVRCECYVPIQERLLLLPELTALRSHVGLCLLSVPPGTAPLHSVFPPFPERRKQALQALNNHLNISVWWLEIINELLNFISCLYNVRCYLAFELQMNLLNHTFFFLMA